MKRNPNNKIWRAVRVVCPLFNCSLSALGMKPFQTGLVNCAFRLGHSEVSSLFSNHPGRLLGFTQLLYMSCQRNIDKQEKLGFPVTLSLIYYSNSLVQTTFDCCSNSVVPATLDCCSNSVVPATFDCCSNSLVPTTLDCCCNSLVPTIIDCCSNSVVPTTFDCCSNSVVPTTFWFYFVAFSYCLYLLQTVLTVTNKNICKSYLSLNLF
jgi:hypothetical protein